MKFSKEIENNFLLTIQNNILHGNKIQHRQTIL